MNNKNLLIKSVATFLQKKENSNKEYADIYAELMNSVVNSEIEGVLTEWTKYPDLTCNQVAEGLLDMYPICRNQPTGNQTE